MTDGDVKFLKDLKIQPDDIAEAKGLHVKLKKVLIEDGCITMQLDDLWAILEGGEIQSDLTCELLTERGRQHLQIMDLIDKQSQLIRQRDGWHGIAVGFEWAFVVAIPFAAVGLVEALRALVPWLVRILGSS